MEIEVPEDVKNTVEITMTEDVKNTVEITMTEDVKNTEQIEIPEDINNIFKRYEEDNTIDRDDKLDEIVKKWNKVAIHIYERGYKAGYMSWKEHKEEAAAFRAVYKYCDTLDTETTNLKTTYSLYRFIYEHFICNLMNEETELDTVMVNDVLTLFENRFFETTQKIDNCNKEFANYYCEWRKKYFGEN